MFTELQLQDPKIVQIACKLTKQLDLLTSALKPQCRKVTFETTAEQ